MKRRGGQGQIDPFSFLEEGMASRDLSRDAMVLFVEEVRKIFGRTRQLRLFPARRLEDPREKALGLKNGDLRSMEKDYIQTLALTCLGLKGFCFHFLKKFPITL
jgi:hypothetical protein